MKTATLTFHGSHNYGSMLQARALQQVMMQIFGHNEIINFRSKRQKRMIRVISLRLALGPMLKDLTHLLYLFPLLSKYRRFEKFIKENLNTSKDEVSKVCASDLQGYDLVCCGSDQIWNPGPHDFDMAYLLPFEIRAKKISYAASMGPGSRNWPDSINRFPELLKAFDRISVREEGTRQKIESLCGRDDIVVNCDPVILLEKEKWVEMTDKKPLINKPYIFLYTLFANKTIVSCAKALSKKYQIPVVISNYTNIYDLFSPFKKHLASGPLEFLNLLYNASMVVTSSFHGTAFSILLNKPFVAVNGLSDNRIANLLRRTSLESRSVGSAADVLKIEWEYDYTAANAALAAERMQSLDYLRSCMMQFHN